MPFGYSLRGHCHTERRKDRWFGNPKGIVSSSPGLPSPRGYPGLASVRFSTPTGLCPLSATGPQPRWGWPTPPALPRVARGSQPWAWGRNPFGILGNSRKALGQVLADRNVRAPSPRGYCRTERRKDRWFGNPKGIVSSSPGLRAASYPGLAPVRFSTPSVVPFGGTTTCATIRQMAQLQIVTFGTSFDAKWHYQRGLCPLSAGGGNPN